MDRMTMKPGWLESKADDAEFRRLLAREDFIEDFLTEVERIMAEKEVSRAALAVLLGCSEEDVAQLFLRAGDLTASTMADLAFHLDTHLQLRVERGLRR